MPYEVWLLIHLSGVIAFLANGIAAFLWRSRAERAGEPRLLAYAYDTLNAGDARLTPASILAIVVGGVGAARTVGLPLLGTPWLLWSIVTFSLSGVIFGTRVAPLQKVIAQRATAGINGTFDRRAHDADARAWTFWAHLSLWLAASSVPLMILKPGA